MERQNVWTTRRHNRWKSNKRRTKIGRKLDKNRVKSNKSWTKVRWMKVEWKSDESRTKVGRTKIERKSNEWKSDRSRTDENRTEVERTKIERRWHNEQCCRCPGGGTTNDVTNTTTLQNTCDLHNDGERDATTMALWGVCEVRKDGARQHDERHAIAHIVAVL